MSDELIGTVDRRVGKQNVPAIATSDGVPEHVLAMKDANPGQVNIMQWTPCAEFEMVDARSLTSVALWIKHEFVLLLQNFKDTDLAFRLRMIENSPVIGKFARNYPKLFTQLTTRSTVLNPALISVVMYQLHCLEQYQAGKITEQQAKALVAEQAMTQLLAESVRQGKLDPNEIPKPEK